MDKGITTSPAAADPGPGQWEFASQQDSHSLGLLPVGSNLADLLVDPGGTRAYVADWTNGRIIVVDLAAERISESVEVRANPNALALNPAATTLFVGHAGDQSVVAIDVATLTVSYTLDIGFQVWDLTAAADDRLIATVRDDPYAGEQPYVLNASDGTIIQRLPGGWSQSDLVFGNNLAVLSPDRQHLFLGDMQTGFVRAYSQAPNGTWTYGGGGPYRGHVAINDMTVSPDGAAFYVAYSGGPGDQGVLAISTTTLEIVGAVGDRCERTLDVSPNGQVIVHAGCPSQVVEAHKLGGQFLGNLLTSAPVDFLRLTPEATRLVAIVGHSEQDIEVLSSVEIAPWVPLGFSADRTPLISGEVDSLIYPLSDLALDVHVDGQSIPSLFDAFSGVFSGTPAFALPEGRRNVSVLALRSGADIARASWMFEIDATRPTFDLDPIADVVDSRTITVSGRVWDANLASLSVGGMPSEFDPSGHFSKEVELTPGENSIVISAADAAGNEASASVAVVYEPPVVWFRHPARHFRIPVPYAWSSQGNITLGGEKVDVLLQGPGGTSIAVVSESRPLSGNSAEARSVLGEALDGLSATPGFRILEPASDTPIDSHPAASAVVEFQGISGNVRQLLTVVIGREWRMFWALAGTVLGSNADRDLPVVRETVQSFDVFASPPENDPAVLIGGTLAAIAAAVVGVVGFVFLLRRRRNGMARERSEDDQTGLQVHSGMSSPFRSNCRS